MTHGTSTTPRSLPRDVAEAVAETMQALATPSRLLILDRLRAAPVPVAELAESVGMEQSATSHQLRVLRHLGLVVAQRRGRQIFYALHDEHVGELLDQAIGHVAHLRLGASEHVEFEVAS